MAPLFEMMKRTIIRFLVQVKRIIFGMMNRRYNDRLRKCRYVHLMFNDKFNKPFVDFLNKYFVINEHLVLCKKNKGLSHPLPVGCNVLKVDSFCGFDFGIENVEKVICHSLFDDEVIDLFYKHNSWLGKCYWMIWGGDLYSATRDEKNDYVRMHCAGIITDTDGDDEVALRIYPGKKRVFRAGYTFPVSWSEVECLHKDVRKLGQVYVQINNSCDETTIEMLNVLSRYKHANIRIRTVLSYGNMKFKARIIETGQRIFGDNFEYIEHYLSPADYSRWMNRNDILILNQDRQQGLGNSFLALGLGVKLYIKKSVTTSKHFASHDIKCFDTAAIPSMEYEDFVSYPDVIAMHNRNAVKPFFDGDQICRLWKPIFM